MLRTAALAVALWLAALSGARAEPPPLVALPTRYDFDTLLARLEAAVERAGMLNLGTASASRGAAGRGISIPGNAVVPVFRNDFAVRLLAIDVAAGIEAPMRFYVTETADHHATLSYRKPSALLTPYAPALAPIATELDQVFDGIAHDAAGG